MLTHETKMVNMVNIMPVAAQYQYFDTVIEHIVILKPDVPVPVLQKGTKQTNDLMAEQLQCVH